MESQYDIRKWEENATKNLFVWQFILHQDQVKSWQITERSNRGKIGEGTLIEYYLENKNAKELAIKVDVYEFTSWKEAQTNLLNQLHDHMAPNLPSLETTGNKIGDVAYTGFGEVEQHILFIRANMLVVLNNIGRRKISVREMGSIIDLEFTSRNVRTEVNLSPDITSFRTTEQEQIFEQEIIGFNIRASDKLQRSIWFKLFTDDGEFFRRDYQIFLRLVAQKNDVLLIATNEDGFNSEKTLMVSI